MNSFITILRDYLNTPIAGSDPLVCIGLLGIAVLIMTFAFFPFPYCPVSYFAAQFFVTPGLTSQIDEPTYGALIGLLLALKVAFFVVGVAILFAQSQRTSELHACKLLKS